MYGSPRESEGFPALRSEQVSWANMDKVTFGSEGWDSCRCCNVLVLGDTPHAIMTALDLASGRENHVWLAPRRSALAELGRELSLPLDRAVGEGRITLQPNASLWSVDERSAVLSLDDADDDDDEWMALPNDRVFVIETDGSKGVPRG